VAMFVGRFNSCFPAWRERTFYTVNVHFNIDNVIIYYSRRRRRLHYYHYQWRLRVSAHGVILGRVHG